MMLCYKICIYIIVLVYLILKLRPKVASEWSYKLVRHCISKLKNIFYSYEDSYLRGDQWQLVYGGETGKKCRCSWYMGVLSANLRVLTIYSQLVWYYRRKLKSEPYEQDSYAESERASMRVRSTSSHG